MSFELNGAVQHYVDDYLMPMLNGLEDIEVHDEIGLIKPDNLTVEFAFQNWNTDFRPRIVKNGSIMTEGTHYRTDYDNGQVRMVTAIVAGDEITGMYRFSLFNRQTLGDFYQRAVTFFNSAHPTTNYTVDNVPEQWVDVLTTAAYKYALQSIMMTAASHRGKLIFPDPTAVISVCGNLLASISGDLYAYAQKAKGRLGLVPRSISSGRWRVPSTVNDHNWQNFTAIKGPS